VIVTVLVPLGPDEVLASGIATRDTGEEEDAGVVAEVVWAVAESPAVLVPVRMLPVAPAVPVRLKPVDVFAPALPHAASMSAPRRPARNAARSRPLRRAALIGGASPIR
jgi:hypothetical protein